MNSRVKSSDLVRKSDLMENIYVLSHFLGG
jgi:hypothetical protein